jgi:hypothetical protein
MSCQNCGAKIPAGAPACPGCSAQIDAAPSPVALASERTKSACRDAWQTFRAFALNPVKNVPIAFESLGPERALGGGLGFHLIYAAMVTGI